MRQTEVSVDSFSSFIKEFINELTKITTTSFGLLDVIESKNVLTPGQIELIREKNAETNRTRQLFLEISSGNLSYETEEQFFIALDQTQHKHVSNFIRGKAKRKADYGDDWPFFCDFGEQAILKRNRPKLIEFIDSENGLLDEMLAADCINIRQRQLVKNRSTDIEKNEIMIKLINSGSIAMYNTFIQCLLLTKQHHVVSLLRPSLLGDIPPLSDEQQSRIHKNYPTLVYLINLMDGLTTELLAADCITWRQKEYIESCTDQGIRKQ